MLERSRLDQINGVARPPTGYLSSARSISCFAPSRPFPLVRAKALASYARELNPYVSLAKFDALHGSGGSARGVEGGRRRA